MNSIVAVIIGAILRALPDDILKTSVAGFINHIEEKIKNDGKTNWEDSTVLPLLEALKKQLGILAPGVISTAPVETASNTGNSENVG